MELRFRVTRRRVALFAAAVAAAVTGSIGWAAIGESGTIQGCVTVNGTIDAIDPITQACKDRQTPVEWYSKAGSDASFLGATAKAADADKLDGLDSTAFLGATAKAADADRLDGRDSSAYLATCPSGMAKVMDFCTETTLRATQPWHVATSFCAGVGRSLPDMGQVFRAWANNSVRNSMFPATPVPVLTDDFISGNELKAPTVSNTGFNHFGTTPDQPGAQFFCVADLVQP